MADLLDPVELLVEAEAALKENERDIANLRDKRKAINDDIASILEDQKRLTRLVNALRGRKRSEK